MRIAFVGAGELTVRTAESILARGHEVVIIESQKEIIDTLSEEMDCGFLHGDGSNPSILQEAGPDQTDILFCLTDSDQVNLIASLVGRSLGFHRVITSIQEPEFEGICQELGLTDTIIPSRTISRYLADMVEGKDILELSTLIKEDARFFSFVAETNLGRVYELDLPAGARVICFYRDGQFSLVDDETRLKKKDEIIVLTHSEHISELEQRWHPKQAKDTISKS